MAFHATARLMHHIAHKISFISAQQFDFSVQVIDDVPCIDWSFDLGYLFSF